jgi:hypothetical protein
MSRTFGTMLCWLDDAGNEQEASVEVTYSTYAGFNGSMVQPSEDPSVEIQTIERTDPGEPIDYARWEDDADLIAECMQDWAEDIEAAAEYRAEQRRDDAMMERWS